MLVQHVMHVRTLKPVLIAAALACSLGTAVAVELDPAKVEGADACAECHRDEAEVWRETHHFKTFREMPRNKDARKIAKKMKVKRIKSESLCLNCHFTRKAKGKSARPISGISCEMCHSEGKEWIKLHAEYSGKGKKENESKAEAAQRWKKSEKLGMIRPHQLYKLAKNCYSCHVVPQEKLVNIGGHTPGSNFELVAWSQGEVRHNLWYTKGKENKKASAARKRMMYITGAVVELETAYRAVAKATVKKSYAVKMAKRATRARKRLLAVAKALPKANEIRRIYKLSKKAGLKLNNETALTKVADRMAVEALKFVTNHDGSKFAAIDKMLPKPDKYKGKPAK